MTIGLNRLTAVVINFGRSDLTIRCVEALVGDGMRHERIVVVDNGSTREQVEELAAALPDTMHVALPENVGYSRAANAGAAALEGDAYLICNNDAFVHRPGSLPALLAALAADPRRGIVVPRILNDDLTLQPTVRPVDTPSVALIRASGLSRHVPNRWQPRWSTYWKHQCSREIVAADGPIVLVRGTAWKQLEGYNPRIRMFAEDTDICWRVRKLGWKIWFEAGSEFVHLGKATTRAHWTDPSRAELVGRSEAALCTEQLGPISSRLSISFTAAGLGARWIVHRTRRDDRATAALGAELRGYLSGLRGETATGSRFP